jgi:2-oxo-4-hydroxy-4-carboxy-5-ureidoimidazoline decarboxylase
VNLLLSDLNLCDRERFVAHLGQLFEHSPWVAEDTWQRRPFSDADGLHRELCATMRAATPERQLALIRAHPDLAGRLAQERRLTAASAQEQASAGLDALSEAELGQFQRQNEAYRQRFGFPFVICARLNARDAIMKAIEKRLVNSPVAEFDAALAEIEKIAWLRLSDLLKPR